MQRLNVISTKIRLYIVAGSLLLAGMTIPLIFLAPALAETSATESGGSANYSEDALKHYNKGCELNSAGVFNQAVTEYRSAIEADNRMEEAYSNLGTIYAAQRNFSKAGEVFQKALSLKPNRPTSLNGLATVLYNRGKTEEAMRLWNQAIQIDPKFAAAYFNMACALDNEHKTSEALTEYTKAISLDPTMGTSFYRIAVLFLKTQHLAQARVMFAKAVILGPDSDYIRDAKKQLSSLDSSFAKETRASTGG